VEKETFLGRFFTSMFKITVNDVTSIPYYVDMIVDHEDSGTVTSSLFKISDVSDYKINGIFFQ